MSPPLASCAEVQTSFPPPGSPVPGGRSGARHNHGVPRTRKLLVRTAGVVAFCLVVTAVLGVWTVRRSLPQTDGELELPGLSAPVEVLRDEHGIPQVYADTAEDLFLAQGFLHAQERFYEMDVRRHVTSGRLAELVGDSALETDVFTRSLGWYDVAEQEVALLDTDTRRYLVAYADGVNAYLDDKDAGELSLEYAVLGLTGPEYAPDPWTPADSVAWLKASAWDLSSNVQDEVDRVLASTVLGPAQVEELYPPYPTETNLPVLQRGGVVGGRFRPAARPDARGARPPLGPGVARAVADRLRSLRTTTGSMPELLGTGDGIGSNSWVLSAERSETGAPVLANDPHLAPSMPGTWVQMGLHCREVGERCPFDVAGVSFSGLPGVVIGHNDRIAWGLTTMYADVADLYVERVRGDTYLYDGRRVSLDTREETFRVAGEDEPVVRTVRATRHGPLLSDLDDQVRRVGAAAPMSRPPGGGTYEVALQWTALTPARTMDALIGFNRAGSWRQFRAAARLFEVPSQNLVYADVDGHIGYQAPGAIPVRRLGDGRWPVPGWDALYGWRGTIPFRQLPWTLDPPGGVVVTANQAVVDPRRYPYELGADTAEGYRSQRILDLLSARRTWSVDDLTRLQTDTLHPMAEVLVPLLVDTPLPTDYADDGQQLLLDWDGTQPPDSGAAAYFNVVWRNLLELTFDDQLPHDVQPAGGERWFLVVTRLLDEPRSRWWDDVTTDGVRETRDEIISTAMVRARQELTSTQTRDSDEWTWGAAHELDLVNPTLGESGNGLVESLFNRGTYDVGGGSGVVDANAWDAAAGYEVTAVASMRMVVPMDDLDAARWITYGGVSGHAFSDHYNDQTETWLAGGTLAWPFGVDAVEAAAQERLLLSPPAEDGEAAAPRGQGDTAASGRE